MNKTFMMISKDSYPGSEDMLGFNIASDLFSQDWTLRLGFKNPLQTDAVEAFEALEGGGKAIIQDHTVDMSIVGERFVKVASNYFHAWDGLPDDLKNKLIRTFYSVIGADGAGRPDLVIIGERESGGVVAFVERVLADYGQAEILYMSDPDFEEAFNGYRTGVMSEKASIENALTIATRYGQIDGDHHKTWAIDTMVRALLGDPVPTLQIDTPKYKEFVKTYCDGEDGPETYEWDTGTAP